MENPEKNNIQDGAAEEYPLQGTMEMIGVKPEGSEGNKNETQEAPRESYKDIGERRMEAVTEGVRAFGGKVGGFMGRAWGKIKSFGSKTKEVTMNTIAYTMAAPEMIKDSAIAVKEGVKEGGAYVGEKVQQGAEYVADRVGETYENAKIVGSAAAGAAFEGAVTAYDKTKEGVVYVSEKGKEAYEGAVNYGKEKFAGLQRRAEDAKGIFQAAVSEARRRRAERMLESPKVHEYDEALANFQSAKQRLMEAEQYFQQHTGKAA